jgi:threonine aldolase
MLGGGTRQAGVLAAAGLYALDHHIERLAQDHDNATSLAELLSSVDEAKVHATDLRTNMVFVSFPPDSLEGLSDHLKEHGILVTARSNPVRLVTHLDLTKEHIGKTVQVIKDYFRVTAGST